MNQEIVVSGNGLSDFLNALYELKKENAVQFEFDAVGDDGDGSSLSVDFLQIAISGLVTTSLSVIIELIKSKIQNEITVTKKSKLGEEIKITLKGLSEKELEKKLTELLSE